MTGWQVSGNSFNLPSFSDAICGVLSTNRIAIIDDTNDKLTTYDFDGSNWVQVGNSLTISGNLSQMAVLSSNRIVICGSSATACQIYEFDGLDWSLIHSGFNTGTSAHKTVAGLSSNRIAFITSSSDKLTTYDFDGSNWVQVGNKLSVPPSNFPRLCSLSSNRVVFIDSSDQLRVYDFDGTNWIKIGNTLALSGTKYSITKLTNNKIAIVVNANTTIRFYSFDETNWTLINEETITVTSANNIYISAFNEKSFVLIENATDTLVKYAYTSLVQLSPTLSWGITGISELTPSLEWSIDPYTNEKMMNPNIINYPTRIDNLTISSVKNIFGFLGSFAGYSYYLENTGTVGTTIIELYVNNVLKKTINISADGTANKNFEYFEMDDIFYPNQDFELRITQVATGATGLSFNSYLMSFALDREFEKTFFGNIKDDVIIQSENKDYFFNNADYWIIDFNQPIYSIDEIYFNSSDEDQEPVEATCEIINGSFYKSRLKITPNTSITISDISVKLKNYNKKTFSFNFTPIFSNYFSYFPEYVVSTNPQEIPTLISATQYRYKFDSGEFGSFTNINENKILVDFSSLTTGNHTLYMEYLNGYDTISENKTIYYTTEDIDCNVIFGNNLATVEYEDYIPLDKVEVYYNDVLNSTANISVKTGFDTVSFNTIENTCTISAGVFYYNDQKYIHEETIYSIDLDFTQLEKTKYIVYLFGFNTETNSFGFISLVDNTPISTVNNLPISNFIPFFEQKFFVIPLDNDWLTYKINIVKEIQDIFVGNIININTTSTNTISIKIIDIFGREKEFDYTYANLTYNIWRTVTFYKQNVDASFEKTGNESKYAFDSTSSYWSTDGGSLPVWVTYDCGYNTKKAVVQYTITNTGSNSPTAWKLQGSNDNENWTDLDDISGVSWSGTQTKTYNISNTTQYTFYRLYITSSNGTYININTITLRETIGGDNFSIFDDTEELLPGQISSTNRLKIDIESDDWQLDGINGRIE